MRIEKTNNTLYAKFDSWPEFVSAVEKSEPTDRYFVESRKDDEISKRFNGGLTYKESVKTAKNGWPQGLELIRKLGSTFYNQLSSQTIKPEMVLAIEGDEIDMGAYMTGDPECFLAWQDTGIQIDKPNNKHVVIDYNISCSGGFNADQLILRGAYICALVDTLESVGKRVTLNLYDGVRGATRRLWVRIQLKAADAPLDLEKTAFAVCHPATLRRLLFAYEESLPYPWYELTYKLPDDPPDLDGDIIINARTWRQASDNLADWAKQILIDQGVEFNDV